ncbi:MAG: TRAP transporter small permease [Polaromonas sp.]|nr:TRAP transporter small permease [Polaromonas sp.]
MIIDAFQRMSSRLAIFGGWAAALILFLMFLLIMIEMGLRNIFSSSTLMMDELVAYGVGCSTLLALGFAFEQGFLIRMELLICAIRKSWQRRLEIINGVLTLIISVLLGWQLSVSIARDYKRSYSSGTMLDLPLYIPKSIMLAGVVIFVITLISYIIRKLANRSVENDLIVEKSLIDMSA